MVRQHKRLFSSNSSANTMEHTWTASGTAVGWLGATRGRGDKLHSVLGGRQRVGMVGLAVSSSSHL